MRRTWRWAFTGGLLGLFLVHPFIMMVASFMFDSGIDIGYPIHDSALSQTMKAFSYGMLPWSVAFAFLGLLLGHFYGRSRLAEEALGESEEKFRSMAVAAQDAIIMMNNKGNISYWNKAAERMFGYSEREAIGTDVLGLSREAVQGEMTDPKSVIQGEALGGTVELVTSKKNGTEFPIELSLSPLQLQGEWHVLGIVRDISERRQAEQERLLREKLQGVLEMAGAACHELNQPLQSILVYLELTLKDLSEDVVSNDHVKILKGQMERIQAT